MVYDLITKARIECGDVWPKNACHRSDKEEVQEHLIMFGKQRHLFNLKFAQVEDMISEYEELSDDDDMLSTTSSMSSTKRKRYEEMCSMKKDNDMMKKQLEALMKMLPSFVTPAAPLANTLDTVVEEESI
jgi:hypothetical protein